MKVSSTRQDDPTGFARRFHRFSYSGTYRNPSHDRRVRHVHVALGHQGDEISIAQAVCKVPADTGFDHITGESATPVNGIAFNGLDHGRLRVKGPGYHGSPAIAPEPR